ncbi:hypothetical protein BJ138DRAFT_1177506 [Hygrophoropsis aurantiaca]|uniref:Uncharacterized protein n=1 Tax=Hygrophoropsis aurantiaca TaxID=72124 RepID=A0ACB8ANC5_9AGAM|nr:hypothetical protein BJ138DRAFT_1177506 [Hygrophoropsis aurantiaca]
MQVIDLGYCAQNSSPGSDTATASARTVRALGSRHVLCSGIHILAILPEGRPTNLLATHVSSQRIDTQYITYRRSPNHKYTHVYSESDVYDSYMKHWNATRSQTRPQVLGSWDAAVGVDINNARALTAQEAPFLRARFAFAILLARSNVVKSGGIVCHAHISHTSFEFDDNQTAVVAHFAATSKEEICPTEISPKHDGIKRSTLNSNSGAREQEGIGVGVAVASVSGV